MIMDCCLGVVFFATPHHGSTLISHPDYVFPVQRMLDLKFPMAAGLCRQLSPSSPYLKRLNLISAEISRGRKIFSYLKTVATRLSVLASNRAGGESFISIDRYIVDRKSAQMSTLSHLVEHEAV